MKKIFIARFILTHSTSRKYAKLSGGQVETSTSSSVQEGDFVSPQTVSLTARILCHRSTIQTVPCSSFFSVGNTIGYVPEELSVSSSASHSSTNIGWGKFMHSLWMSVFSKPTFEIDPDLQRLLLLVEGLRVNSKGLQLHPGTKQWLYEANTHSHGHPTDSESSQVWHSSPIWKQYENAMVMYWTSGVLYTDHLSSIARITAMATYEALNRAWSPQVSYEECSEIVRKEIWPWYVRLCSRNQPIDPNKVDTSTMELPVNEARPDKDLAKDIPEAPPASGSPESEFRKVAMYSESRDSPERSNTLDDDVMAVLWSQESVFSSDYRQRHNNERDGNQSDMHKNAVNSKDNKQNDAGFEDLKPSPPVQVQANTEIDYEKIFSAVASSNSRTVALTDSCYLAPRLLEKYTNIYRSILAHITRMRRELLTSLTPRVRTRMVSGLLSGSHLTASAVFKAVKCQDYRIFESPNRPQRISSAVVLLLDRSSSMQPFQVHTTTAAVLFTEALHCLPGVRFEVTVFSHDSLIIKPLEKPLTRITRSAILHEVCRDGGSTRTDLAVYRAMQRLRSQPPQTDKIIIVINDGDKEVGFNRTAWRAMLSDAEKEAISIYGVGLGSGAELVCSLFPNDHGYHVPNATALPRVVANLLRSRLTSGGSTALCCK